MITRNEATEHQVRASMPQASTWLAANAGSGKTRVLTDRVARLLLIGVEPQNILCLTYTKAAASEMQNRLFRRLGEWAMLDDDSLAQALDELGNEVRLDKRQIRHARTLFARAIEAPGGLKIQTIHSFCAGLLRRFPLEAGVSPQFTEIEDRAARLLRAQIVEDFAQGAHVSLVDDVARYLTDADFGEITQSIVSHRDLFAKPCAREDLNAALGIPADFTADDLVSSVFLGNERSLLDTLIPTLAAGSSTDAKAAAKLSALAKLDIDALAILESVFLTGSSAKSPFSAKIDSFPTKKTRETIPALMPELNAFMKRVETARERRLAQQAVDKSLALHRFAAAFLPELERRKKLRGWLDFDDQILKARQLLNDPAVAAWVLFRLDGGIDHILVDEAQDTSPEQWDVIEKLAQEFTSGEGARSGVERTIFVVGDKKQSIYSFQGADPREFDRMQEEFKNRLNRVGKKLETLTLEFSFRSAQSLLQLVDTVFAEKGSAGFDKKSLHRAFKNDLPGRVDLWPLVEKVDDRVDQHWSEPLDRPSPRSHTVVLAERIATQIRQMIDEKQTVPDDRNGTYFRRPVRAGDFLILVQRRSDLFGEIIRACKQADLPIAGADRLKIGAELAVRDLAALLRFLSTPEDDLSLACVLKSPLFGWKEQDLFTLAHGRGAQYLWEALRKADKKHAQTLVTLLDMRDAADFLRPYDLIERMLIRHDGRKRLLGRLGVEAEDGINALLGQALAYERTEIPSLTGFLTWMETDDLEIKRQMSAAGDMVRVMTVHGAKGLESPIVILPDTAKRQMMDRSTIVETDGVAFWKPRSDDMPGALTAERDAAREREMQERQRLLYVALTRVEKWLIVTAAGDLDKEGNSWYQQVAEAMKVRNAIETDKFDGRGLMIKDPDWDTLPLVEPETLATPKTSLPKFYADPAPKPDTPREVLSPSDLGGAKALPGAAGEDEETAKRRGTLIHLLLEHLSALAPETWDDIAAHILKNTEPAEAQILLAEARNVLKTPALAFLFNENCLAEVPITAEIGGQRLHGVIDRLVIDGSRILAVDFKSNAIVPASPADCPDGLLRQMGAYALQLKQIYPDREIETAILWTKTAELMHLPYDIVIDALNHTPHLDLTGTPT